jgi:hypothetical protein
MRHLLNAKATYGNVYYLPFESENAVAIFNIITIKEYEAFVSLHDRFPLMRADLELDLFKKCLLQYISPLVLYKQDELTDEDVEKNYVPFERMIEVIEAGVVDTVVKAILYLSGKKTLSEVVYDITSNRDFVQNDGFRRVLAVVSYMYKIPMDELYRMEYPDLLNIINHAELITLGDIPEFPLHLDTDTNKLDKPEK